MSAGYLQVLCGMPTRQRGKTTACPAPLAHVEPGRPDVLHSDRLQMPGGGPAVAGVVRLAALDKGPVAFVCPRHGTRTSVGTTLVEAARNPTTRTLLLP